jgi:hypothetical protein
MGLTGLGSSLQITAKEQTNKERVNEDSKEIKDARFKATYKYSLFSNFMLFQATMKVLQLPLNFKHNYIEISNSYNAVNTECLRCKISPSIQ